MHILFIRFSSLGDVILNSSLPQMVKSHFGQRVHVSFLTSKGFAPLMEGHPAIDSLYGFSRASGISGLKELYQFIQSIRQERPIDLIVDMHGTIRSLFIRAVFFSIPRIFVDKRTLERWVLTGLRLDFLSWQGPKGRKPGFGELLLERNLRDFQGIFNYHYQRDDYEMKLGQLRKNHQLKTLSAAGLSFKDAPFDYQKHGLEILTSGPFITVVPSASFPEKRWPVEKFIALFELLLKDPGYRGWRFIILAGPEDTFCERFDSLVEQNKGRLFNLQGKTNLVESTLLVRDAAFCVGNDTGIPHMAEAMGTPIVAILGPTGEQFGYYPHLTDSEVVKKDIWCRPCTTNGKGHCIRSERYCLNLISTSDVLEKMDQVKASLG